MNNQFKIKKLVFISILAALTVILQLLSMYLKFGPFSATLALIPLIIGAIIFGPGVGFMLGFIMGFIILLTDSQAFFVINPFYTIIICLTKTSIAGLVAGYIFKILNKFNFKIAVIVTALITPIINTTIFALLCILFFYKTLQEWAGNTNALNYLFLTMIGINFLIEFILNSVLSPVFVYLIDLLDKKHDLGLIEGKNDIIS